MCIRCADGRPLSASCQEDRPPPWDAAERICHYCRAASKLAMALLLPSSFRQQRRGGVAGGGVEVQGGTTAELRLGITW